MSDPERDRLAQADAGLEPWRDWGPYVAERAWGTVREDYSATGDAWAFFPHDHARSRTYRWNEDGMAGVCDQDQTWCLALALWNGVDPILKERMFGLTGPEGNHGEDVKECWWYLDATPTSSWLRWRYHYPQKPFPYNDLVATNAARGRLDPEYELLDTGIFDDHRYWVVDVTYAKAGPRDLCLAIDVTNASDQPASIDVLPTLWFRNTWAWGIAGQEAQPTIEADGARLVASHHRVGELVLDGGLPGNPAPEPLACDNETNTGRLWGTPGRSAYPKDGINDHVVHGAATVNPARTGTKAALRYRLEVPAGGSARIRLRLTGDTPPPGAEREPFDAVLAARQSEADAFHAALVPPTATDEEAAILRQAFAGLLWGKQFYHYDVEEWLDGDPAGPPPPPARQTGRNSGWRHLNNHDVISMPDPWEYPWYAAWDLAFHCVPLARLDPEFAKQQLVLLCREWYMHPNGQLPAYEWAFGDVNPPVQALAALQVFTIDGSRDHAFLERVFHKLLINFTWWVNRKDAAGNNLFEGGFLGLDNIGPLDRSAALPVAGRLEQSDGTAWMALYCLTLLQMALVLAEHDAVYQDTATKFLEHFAYIAQAARDHGLWQDDEGFFCDVLSRDDGQVVPLRVRSMVGLIPLMACATLGEATLDALPDFAERARWFITHDRTHGEVLSSVHERDGALGHLFSVVSPQQLPRILTRLFDESEFLSANGIRSLSAAYRGQPYVLELDGTRLTVDYEPAESTSGLFGGNSNWRGPVWFPMNYLLVQALRRFARFYGDDLRVELPTGSGVKVTAADAARLLSDRLVALFRRGPDGLRPADGARRVFADDPHWRDLITFNEYFHGDTGAGLGASHQTGWTALVAELLIRRDEGVDTAI